MSQLPGMTVVETTEYLKLAESRMTENERAALVWHLSRNPKAGVVVTGTGGVRKLRWAADGKGKRGGVRVIYYHYNETVPLFVLAVFAKKEKSNMTNAERREAKKLVKAIVGNYKGANRG